MRYFAAMGIRVPLAAVMLGLLPATALAAPATPPAAQRAANTIVSAVRFANGASATALVSARIIRQSARIGAGFAPPGPRMVPRTATVTAADGRPVPALVYDFE